MSDRTKKRKRRGKKTRSKKRKVSSDKPPKRPKSAYFLFMDDHRKDLLADDNYKKDGKAEGTRVCDISKMSKELGRMWKALTEEEQVPYKEKAVELKKIYAVEKDKWDEYDSPYESKTKRGSSSESESGSGSESESD